MPKLVLVRHGQSEWNLQNRFTGWVDVNLTEEGVAQAKKSGDLLKAAGFEPDLAFTSVLTRAIKTLNFTLEGLDRLWVPVEKSWRLNERHYGGLAGLNKDETRAKHGKEQVHIWRRSFDTPPPPLPESHEYHPLNDRRYAGIDPALLPALTSGKDVIVAAHGNSLRALVKLLFAVSDDDIMGVEIPTGNPLLIELDDSGTKPITAAYLDQDRAQSLPALPA